MLIGALPFFYLLEIFQLSGYVLLNSQILTSLRRFQFLPNQHKQRSYYARKFELKIAKDGKFTFNLKAVNGRVILTSQTYKSKAAVKNGIKSVCTNYSKNERFEQKISKKVNRTFYF